MVQLIQSCSCQKKKTWCVCERNNVKKREITCIESALMTSPPYLRAISNASFDLPVPVAPQTTITGTRFKSFVVVAPILAAAMLRRLLDCQKKNKRDTIVAGSLSLLVFKYFFKLKNSINKSFLLSRESLWNVVET